MNSKPITSTIAQRAFRFGVSGLLVTALHVIVATALIKIVATIPWLANGIAFFIATTFSYIINTTWSFSNPLHGENLLRFCLVSCLGLVLAMSVSALAQAYGLPYWCGI